jgi:co-chaperonin GroES (HSP10)
MKAIGKNIIVRTIEEEVRTSSGLLISGEEAQSLRYRKGRVVMPGTEVENIKKGDLIYYDTRQSYKMLIKDEPYTIIQERDVVVVE